MKARLCKGCGMSVPETMDACLNCGRKFQVVGRIPSFIKGPVVLRDPAPTRAAPATGDDRREEPAPPASEERPAKPAKAS